MNDIEKASAELAPHAANASAVVEVAADPAKPALPFLKRYPILMGAAMGLLMRVLVFDAKPGGAWSTMAGAFIWLAPIMVGMVTVYVAERAQRRSWMYYIGAPALAALLFVVGTLVIMYEGWICAVVIVPMFVAMASAGGLLMGAVCRWTAWPRPAVYSATALPLLLGIFGAQLPQPEQIGLIERSVFIQAPAATVWRQLHEASGICPTEVERAWAYRIGVPLPLSGVTEDTPEGKVRRSRWDKGVHFDELVQDWQPERYVRWTYRFAPDSFPKGALDDHVVIGGHYFDLLDTAYTLTPENNGTRLTMTVHYRISTQFNLYADWVAQALLGNFGEVILDMYGARAVADTAAAGPN
jgi:hypothetical protein